ncbi:MAG: hypothetical protein QME75_11210 [Deltaproteobacteria bacterium]|nr:hypothetical protein [Deltaproteobacteria bacterium]
MNITNEVRLSLVKEWLRRIFILLEAQIDASGQLTAAQKNLIKAAVRRAAEETPPKEWDFFINGDRHIHALNGGILRLADGSRLLLAQNPLQAWAGEEWEAFKTQKQAQAARLAVQLNSLPKPKTMPDMDTLAFWNSHASIVSGAEQVQADLLRRREELAELESI